MTQRFGIVVGPSQTAWATVADPGTSAGGAPASSLVLDGATLSSAVAIAPSMIATTSISRVTSRTHNISR